MRVPRGRPGGHAALVLASSTRDASIVLLDTTSRECVVVARASTDTPDERFLSRPEPIEFLSDDRLPAHALFYRPTNPDFVAPAHELPPLLVKVHGGPTAMAVRSISNSSSGRAGVSRCST
ncbi:MAG: hypothetical protein ACLQBX_16795 [Candidatus Limnocylindrales bacterium]